MKKTNRTLTAESLKGGKNGAEPGDVPFNYLKCRYLNRSRKPAEMTIVRKNIPTRIEV